MSKNVLNYLATSIVEEADGVVVETEERRNSVTLRLHVAPSDMGRVIGRRGRVAQAIRSVVRAAGAKEGVDATVDIVD
ncbi:MAG: KH domain-containing protein [Acidimicrobiia bacterium]|nr:KH domain-containing protein [Acidimicrobiia bacterium]MBV9039661.1 KH domain-containing protein [Acidimicrobiia bacterium]MBV9283186.1 KH domain-containing protein [Acidimicrobiia bacterium]